MSILTNLLPPCLPSSPALSSYPHPPFPPEEAELSHSSSSLTLNKALKDPQELTSNFSTQPPQEEPPTRYGKIKRPAQHSQKAPYTLSGKEIFTKEEWNFLNLNGQKKLLADKDTQIRALQEENRVLKNKNQILRTKKEKMAIAEDAVTACSDDEPTSSTSSSSSSSSDPYLVSSDASSHPEFLPDFSLDDFSPFTDTFPPSSTSTSKAQKGKKAVVEEAVMAYNNNELTSSTSSSSSAYSLEEFLPDFSLGDFPSFATALSVSSNNTASPLQAGKTLSSPDNNPEVVEFADLQEKLQTIKRLKRENENIKIENIKIQKSYKQHLQSKKKPAFDILISEKKPKNLIFLTEQELFKTVYNMRRYEPWDRRFLHCAKMSQAIAIELLVNNPLLCYRMAKNDKTACTISGVNHRKDFSIQCKPPNSLAFTYSGSLRNFSFPEMSFFSGTIPYVLLQASRGSLGHYLLIKDVTLFSIRAGGGCLSGRVVHISINTENHKITLTPTPINHRFYPHNYNPLGLLSLSQEKLFAFLKNRLADQSIAIENIPTREGACLENISLLNLAVSEPLIKIS